MNKWFIFREFKKTFSMMGDSVMALIDGWNQNGDHFPVHTANRWFPVHYGFIQSNMGIQWFRVQAVNFQDIIDTAPGIFQFCILIF